MLFFASTVLQLGVLWALMLPVLGPDDAAARALVMLPPVLWTARLVVAVRRGRITRRLVKWMGRSYDATLLRISNPEIYTRRDEPWNYRGYLLFESLLCLLCWALFGGPVVLMPLLDALGVPL